jgi:RNA polymerase sigma-70 factor (ECF subfamily)
VRLLVDRARAHDFAAFEQLVARHRARVYALALQALQDPAAAEQAVQDTFLAAWEALPGLKAGEPFLPWLTVVCAGLLSKRMPQGAQADAGKRLAQPRFHSSGALAEPARDWRARATVAGAHDLRHAVADLPTEHRTAFVFRDLGRLTYREIADVLGTTAVVVRRRVHEARLALLCGHEVAQKEGAATG